MTAHVLPGPRCVPLINYLAVLRVAKGVPEQASPAARLDWRVGVFHMDTEVGDITEFFVRDFTPTPAFSPWNAGSGFDEKDKTPLKYIRTLKPSTTTGFTSYRDTFAVVRLALIVKSGKGRPKERPMQELRDQLPDDTLLWMGANVVLTAKETEYPPIPGIRENDGRLDFSTNVHQRLINVLSEFGTEPERS